jgi:hypothetical protein
MGKFMIRIIASTTAASALLLAGHSSIAAPTKVDCEVGYKVCYRGCKGPAGDLGEPCRAQCDVDLVRCHDKVGGKENRPKGGAGPKGGPLAKDPVPAKSGPSSDPPKSGTWHGPVSRPKSGPVWHGPASPPKSGPVWNGPATPPKGIGGSGPVLKSGGAKR